MAWIEIQVIIAMFFKNFDAELIPDKKLKMNASFITSPVDDELISVKPIWFMIKDLLII